MRRILCAVLILIAVHGRSQDFAGYQSGNYTGVNSVFFNPANIADSRYYSDFNVLSASTFAGSNQASFKLKSLVRTTDQDSIRQQVMGNKASPVRALVNLDVHGPAYMFNTGRRSYMAITTRMRVMVNIDDVNGKLLESLDDFKNDRQLPYTFSSGGSMRVSVNAWKETGLSYARVLLDNDAHFLKGGFSLKYLAGIANGFIHIDNFTGTVHDDKAKEEYYLTGTTGGITTGFGGLRMSDLRPADFFSRQSTGFGADIGFVYEYRPEHKKYRVPGTNNWRKDRNKYKWKAGLALLDIGSIRYRKDMERSGAYSVHVKGDERFYLNELGNVAIDDFKYYFNSRPQYFTAEASNTDNTYEVFLPATLQMGFDYHLYRGFYAGFSGQVPLVGKDKPASGHSITSFTLTPRYEGKAVGFYLPVNYNSITKFNAGASLRLGPLFVGSGSLLTAALGQSKQADIFAGFRLGGLQKNVVRKREKAEKKMLRKERREQKKQA